MGEARFGVYRDECEDIHPDTINKYYGVDQVNDTKHQDETGAGNSADETGEMASQPFQPDPEELAQQIAQNQSSQTRHEGVPVKPSQNPFENEEAEAHFFSILHDIVHDGVLPVGYGILPDELEGGIYPNVEIMRIGPTRSQKEIKISLEDKVWEERSKLWVQGLSVLTHCLPH